MGYTGAAVFLETRSDLTLEFRVSIEPLGYIRSRRCTVPVAHQDVDSRFDSYQWDVFAKQVTHKSIRIDEPIEIRQSDLAQVVDYLVDNLRARFDICQVPVKPARRPQKIAELAAANAIVGARRVVQFAPFSNPWVPNIRVNPKCDSFAGNVVPARLELNSLSPLPNVSSQFLERLRVPKTIRHKSRRDLFACRQVSRAAGTLVRGAR